MADVPTRTEKRISSLKAGDYEQDKSNAFLPASVGSESTHKYPLDAMEKAAKAYTDSAIANAVPVGNWLPNTTSNSKSTGVTQSASIEVKNSASIDASGSSRIYLAANGLISIIDNASLGMQDGSSACFREAFGENAGVFKSLPQLPNRIGPYSMFLGNSSLKGYVLGCNECTDIYLQYMDISRSNISEDFSTSRGWRVLSVHGNAGGGLDGSNGGYAFISIPQNTQSPYGVDWNTIDGIGSASFLVIGNSVEYSGRINIYNTPQDMRRVLFVIGVGSANSVQIAFSVSNNSNGGTFNISPQSGGVVIFSNSYAMYQQVSAGGQMQ